MNQSIYIPTDNQIMIDRINKLTAETPANWGKMTPTQLFRHCNAAVEVAFAERTMKINFFIKLLGKMLKNKVFNSDFKRNSPTAPELIFTDSYDFETAKKELITNFSKFAKGHSSIKVFDHPFWGKMNYDDWNKLMWRHLDHHLIQFGV